MNHSFKKLVKTGLLELVREPRTCFFVLFFPLIFLGMFAIIGSVIPPSKESPIHFLEFMFPGILIFALFCTGIFGTAMPLIEMRKKGTIRMFEVTPLTKETFIISQVTVRFIVSLFQILLFLILGLLLKIVHVENIIPILYTSMLGMTMILTLGFVLGGFFKSVEIAGGLLGALAGPLLMFSGVLFPLHVLPPAVSKTSMISPFTYFGDAIRQILYPSLKSYPMYVDLLVMTFSAVVLFLIAKSTFKWKSRL